MRPLRRGLMGGGSKICVRFEGIFREVEVENKSAYLSWMRMLRRFRAPGNVSSNLRGTHFMRPLGEDLTGGGSKICVCFVGIFREVEVGNACVSPGYYSW